METIINILILSVSVLFGAVWSSYILLPFIYGIPRAFIWVVKGFARPICLFLYLISPAIGLGIFFIIWYYFPSFIANPGIKIGVVLFLFRTVFSSSQRLDMNEDFLVFITRYLTQKGIEHLDMFHYRHPKG